MDDCSEVAVVGKVEVRGIPNGSTKLDGFKGIGVIGQDELGN